MRTIIVLLVGVMAWHTANAQKVKADPDRWKTTTGRVSFERGSIHLENDGKGTAILWIENLTFANGTVTFDIKGKNEPGNSFLGLAFHGSGDMNYDAVYFRPFNFKNIAKKGYAVQYINAPENDWNVLRKNFPGKYENEISPVPDPDDWFHVRIEIDSPRIKVYVNGAKQPTLEVDKIGKINSGKLGLWVDSDEGWFRNVEVHKR